jgi:hypothetical protein
MSPRLAGETAGNEDSTEQALFYPHYEFRPRSLSFFPLRFPDNGFDRGLMARKLASPAAGGVEEFGRQIGDLDADEPCLLHQDVVGCLRGNCRWSQPERFAMLFAVEAGAGNDRRVGQDPALPKETSTGPQHGELWVQSTQDVGMADSVKRPIPERKPAGRTDDASQRSDPLMLAAYHRTFQALNRQVGHDNFATRLPCEI